MAHGQLVKLCNDHIEWIACADVDGVPSTIIVKYPLDCNGLLAAPSYFAPADGSLITGTVSNIKLGMSCEGAIQRDVENACAYVPGDDTQPAIPLYIRYTVDAGGVVTKTYYRVDDDTVYTPVAPYIVSDDCQFDFETQNACALVAGIKTEIVRTIARPRGINAPTVIGQWLNAQTLVALAPQPAPAEFVPCEPCGTIEKDWCVFDAAGCHVARVTAIYDKDCTTGRPTATPPTLLSLNPTTGALEAFALAAGQTLGSCDADLANCDCACPAP